MAENYLIPEQIGVLLAAIKPHRVGRDGKGFSHVEAYELRAHLNRIFGFARWSEEVIEQECIFEDSEQKTGKKGPYTAWTVCYRSLVRLTVCAPDGTVLCVYTEGATGDATNQPSRADAHDLSLKTSASQAFKRCCMNLGDAFGLSLYRKGSLEPLVKVTLVNGDGGAAGTYEGADIQDAAPPTFRAPDPEPGADLDEHGGAPNEVPPPTPPGPPPAPAEQPAPKRSKEEYRAAILAAESKQGVWHLLRDIAEAGWALEETTNAAGTPMSFNDLATAAAKGLKS